MPLIVSISAIQSAGTQTRVGIEPDVVKEYAEALRNGATFPPITLYHDGQEYWLADGYHRLAAYRLCGEEYIPADVHRGGFREALLYATGANASHGLRRTREDVRKAIRVLLKDPEWSLWSDREIARRVGCTHPTVAAERRKIEATIATANAMFSSGDGKNYQQENPWGFTAESAIKAAQSYAPGSTHRQMALNRATEAIAHIRETEYRDLLESRVNALANEQGRSSQCTQCGETLRNGNWEGLCGSCYQARMRTEPSVLPQPQPGNDTLPEDTELLQRLLNEWFTDMLWNLPPCEYGLLSLALGLNDGLNEDVNVIAGKMVAACMQHPDLAETYLKQTHEHYGVAYA